MGTELESANLAFNGDYFSNCNFLQKMDTHATNLYLILLLIAIIIVDTISNNNIDILALIFLRERYGYCLM